MAVTKTNTPKNKAKTNTKSTRARKPRIAPAKDKLNAAGIDVICERIAECESLKQIADSFGVSQGTLIVWLAGHPEQYARAREFQADRHAEEILRIADDGSRDTYTDEHGNIRTDQEVVARSRLRVDARKWLASKMRPKVYGDRLNLDADVKVSDLTDEQLFSKIASLSDKLGLSVDVESLKNRGLDTKSTAPKDK